MIIGIYFRNLAVVFLDEGANVLLGGNPHETLSDRAALARAKGARWGCVLCWLLGKISPGHCDRALAVVETPLADQP